jgi:O-antigen/teichoic acid export membrane protein
MGQRCGQKEYFELNPSSAQQQRHLLGGTTRVFLAEAFMLPAGLVIAMFLTRKFGPQGYGLFTLAAAIITAIEVIISSLFRRTTVKFVSDTTDWRPVGDVVMRLHLMVSASAALLLFLFADVIGTALNEPILAAYLRLFALDIPLFSLAGAQRYVLIGLGGYSQRAIISAIQGVTRLVLILLLVELGLSVPGAILGIIGASLAAMMMGHYYVRLSPFRRSDFAARLLFGYAAWLFLYSISMIIYNKMDLFMLKILGGTADLAGIYGAAQNLAHIPHIFGLSFTPLLLATLGRMLRAEDYPGARELGRNAMRALICLFPFAGMTAGAAQEIVVLIFGRPFISAASILAILIFAALFTMIISVGTAILTAAGKPRWTFALTGPLIPLALLGHLLLIPRLGSVGAALTTTLFAIFGAGATLLAVYRIWRIVPPVSTLLRSMLISGIAFSMAAFWPTPGFLLILKIILIVIAIPLKFLLLGEFKAGEIDLARSIFSRQPGIEQSRRTGNN